MIIVYISYSCCWHVIYYIFKVYDSFIGQVLVVAGRFEHSSGFVYKFVSKYNLFSQLVYLSIFDLVLDLSFLIFTFDVHVFY